MKIAQSNGYYVVKCPYCEREHHFSNGDCGHVFNCQSESCDKSFIVGDYEPIGVAFGE